MKIALCIFTATYLFATSPFETPKENNFDLSVFDTKPTKETLKATENPMVKCRYVCDKKIYTEQKIAEAISFYKKSSDNPSKSIKAR
jgi:hypothetical protein